MLAPAESENVAAISRLIGSKQWYELTDSGAFSLAGSAKKIALQLNQNLGWGTQGLVEEALKEAITPANLTKVDDGRTLIKALVDLKKYPPKLKDLFPWTEGDEDWQRYKIRSSGVGDYVPEEDCEIIRHNKELRVKKWLEENHDSNLLVGDDKLASILAVKEFEPLAKKNAINLFTFQVSLNGSNNPNSLYNYAKILLKWPAPLTIFLDFDGVTYDTDSALREHGAVNIYTKHSPKSQPSASQI